MTRAYRVSVVGGGLETTEVARARTARGSRGRPNWWLILAVSLGLIAVLVATAGTTPRAGPGSRTLGQQVTADARRAAPSAPSSRHAAPTRPRTTSTTAPLPTGGSGAGDPSTSALLSPNALGTVAAGGAGGGGHPASAPPIGVTATTAAPAAPTTTTTSGAGNGSQPSARATQSEGVLNPPLQSSQAFVFTGSGPMAISVVWSGSTYLTMVVSCANGGQSVGGTSAMQANLPDAQGSCRATVSEPSSESTALTFTITIGPAGG